MIQITFLGTGSMMPTKQRNHSAIMLSYKTENILMDCGGRFYEDGGIR